ncbi:MAG: prolyl-tRNA synthetase associated domain-containing protein [Oscillospiraceae bacterium]
MDILALLDSLDIKYSLVKHEPVFKCEQAQLVKNLIDGQGCKNLFLKSPDRKYFMYILPDYKRADLKAISKKCEIGRLSFANENELYSILNLKPGSVTPFGIINDNDNKVTLIIDYELQGKMLLFHPNDNTRTLNVHYDDLIKFIVYMKHSYFLV